MGRIIPHLISCVSQFSLLSEEKQETQRPFVVHTQDLINSRFFVSIGFYMNAKLTMKPMCKEQVPLFAVQRKLGLGAGSLQREVCLPSPGLCWNLRTLLFLA